MEVDLNQPRTLHNRDEVEAYNNQRRVRVPFINSEMGLGDAIARMTGAVGVEPCGGCKARQEALNKQVRLTPWAWG